MAQSEESYEITEEKVREQAFKLTNPEALRRMGANLRSSGAGTFANTLATMFESCAQRIERGARVGTLARLSGSIKNQLEEMADEMGLVADDSFWEMDLALFAFMRESLQKAKSK